MGNECSFCIVIVTYNRSIELKKALNCYDKQVLQPKQIIVVDNNSTDDTKQILSEWVGIDRPYKKEVITLKENTGGAGGFYVGIEKAVFSECEYIFLADDDAFADKDMLLRLSEYICANSENNVVAYTTMNINRGEPDTSHRRRVKKSLFTIHEVEVQKQEYTYESFEIDELSFVGSAIRTNIVKEIGLPKKEYFIYFDDTEFSYRIREKGKILCVPSSKMIHNANKSKEKGWGYYYGVRNHIDAVKTHYSKRYLLFLVIVSYIKYASFFSVLFKWHSFAFRKMNLCAIRDGINGKLGIDIKYKPGYKV